VFDAQVVHTTKSSPRGKLLSQYVTARIASMTNIDIGLFDYDRHNALYFFIMNADEHIYMRYGGRDARSPDSYLDLDSLEVALTMGLERHERYKQGKLEKQTRPEPFFPRDIPGLKKEILPKRCVECHLIADYKAQEAERAGELDKLREMYASPDIRTIGIELDVSTGLVVKDATGAVERAGMEPGDLIVGIDGTPTLTFGDLQHFYNKTPRDAKRVRIAVDRHGETNELTIDLPKEWWWTDLYHRFWSVEPVLTFSTRPLSDREKKRRGLKVDGFASEVTQVNLRSRTGRRDEIRPGDVIYSVNGVEVNEATRNCETYIKLTMSAGESFSAKVLRSGTPTDVRIRTRRQRYRK
jgi:hypothetical protein